MNQQSQFELLLSGLNLSKAISFDFQEQNLAFTFILTNIISIGEVRFINMH